MSRIRIHFVCAWVLLATGIVADAAQAGETNVSPESCSQSVRVVLGDGGRGLMERQDAVGQLDNRLSDEEYKALFQFLARKPMEDALTSDELDALKNEVVNCLKNQGRNPAELIRRLVVLHQDESQGEVWRDYCVQHLGTLYKAAEGADREATRKLLFQATELMQSSIPGTALIALANNSGTTEMPVRQVTDKAVTMAGDASYGEAARITALQICAKFSDMRVLLPAREIAFGKYGAPLRVSAIAALGAMGDGSDLDQLKPLVQSTDIRLRTAAAAAVKKLSEKAEEKP